ncbi:MAG: HTTM domain-containing protein [Bdellovibrionales bacterium]
MSLWRIFQLDLRALALTRILFGISLLLDIATRLPDFNLFYTDQGVLPRSCFICRAWSLHNLSGSLSWTTFLFVVQILAALAMIFGFRTRAATVLSWLLLVSLNHRNRFVLQSGDSMAMATLFWAMFLPWGSYYSLDAKKLKDTPKVISGLPTFAFLFQMAMVYGLTGFHKSGPQWHSDYSALYHIFMAEQYSTPLSAVLLDYPLLLKIVTACVLYFEISFPVLLLFPFAWIRASLIFGLLGLHLGILTFMNVGMFPLYSMSIVFSLLPSRAFRNPEEPRPEILKIHLWQKSAIVAALTGIILSVFVGSRMANFKAPVDRFIHALGVRQPWIMFAFGESHIWWHVIKAEARDGQTLNLFPEPHPYSEAQPERVDKLYRSQRWLKLMANLKRRVRKPERHRLLISLCRPEYRSVELLYLTQEILPEKKYGDVRIRSLSKIECSPP